MRKQTFAALGACLLVAGCGTTGSAPSLSNLQALVEAGVSRAIQTPARVSGLKSRYDPDSKSFMVCGYASVLNQPSMPPALFSGVVLSAGQFVLMPTTHAAAIVDKSAGQDPRRIALVRDICARWQVDI